VSAAPAADLARLVDLVESFPRQEILLLGDFVADEFVFGEISRVSREAPVLILRHRETLSVPGGGANAANNLADLGARVLPVAALGEDAAGDTLAAYFKDKGVDISGLVRARGWRTPAKTRFLAGWTHTARQQVLRMDNEPSGPPPERAADALERKARERLSGASAVLVSDYGYGSAAPQSLRAILPKKRSALPITLDSRYRLHGYAGLRLTAATPNEAELEAAHHEEIGGKPAKLETLARRTMTRLGLQSLVVTRGRDGMTVFERGQSPRSLAVFGSDQAVDVTGAGDTVIAAFTLAIAAGGSAIEAAQLANYAGGIVVMKRGTATVTREELLGAIRADATGGAAAAEHA
jgi:D-glycero-beta-D-manno-heptose-7-phosphate kinase